MYRGFVSSIWAVRYLHELLVDLAVPQMGLDTTIAVANELFLTLEESIAWSSHLISGRFHRAKRENPGKGQHHSDLWSPMRCTVVYIGTVAIDLTAIEMS